MFTPGKIMTLFAVSGACCFGMLWAQQDDATEPVTKERKLLFREEEQENGFTIVDTIGAAAPSDIARVYRSPNSGNVAYTFFSAAPNDHGLNKALTAYRNAKADSTERKEAREKVAKGLSDMYDEQLKRQEKQIEELADRLDKLRVQLAKRRDAKARMVDLKLEMVLSQADGLGWPEDSAFSIGSPISAQNVLVAPSFGSTAPQPALAPLPPAEPAGLEDLPPASAPTRATTPRR